MSKPVLLEQYEWALILRRRLGLDQSQAAQVAGMSRQTVAQAEANKASLHSVRALVAALEEEQDGIKNRNRDAANVPYFDLR